MRPRRVSIASGRAPREPTPPRPILIQDLPKSGLKIYWTECSKEDMADGCDNVNDIVDEWIVKHGQELWDTRLRRKTMQRNRPDPGPIDHVRVMSSFGSGTSKPHVYCELMTGDNRAIGVRIFIEANSGAKASVMRNHSLLEFLQEGLAVLSDEPANFPHVMELRQAELCVDAGSELVPTALYRGKRKRFLQGRFAQFPGSEKDIPGLAFAGTVCLEGRYDEHRHIWTEIIARGNTVNLADLYQPPRECGQWTTTSDSAPLLMRRGSGFSWCWVMVPIQRRR